LGRILELKIEVYSDSYYKTTLTKNYGIISMEVLDDGGGFGK
jgi:hypothetical protein